MSCISDRTATGHVLLRYRTTTTGLVLRSSSDVGLTTMLLVQDVAGSGHSACFKNISTFANRSSVIIDGAKIGATMDSYRVASCASYLLCRGDSDPATLGVTMPFSHPAMHPATSFFWLVSVPKHARAPSSPIKVSALQPQQRATPVVLRRFVHIASTSTSLASDRAPDFRSCSRLRAVLPRHAYDASSAIKGEQ